jgi:transporter family protein
LYCTVTRRPCAISRALRLSGGRGGDDEEQSDKESFEMSHGSQSIRREVKCPVGLCVRVAGAAAVTAILAKIGVEGVRRTWRPRCAPPSSGIRLGIVLLRGSTTRWRRCAAAAAVPHAVGRGDGLSGWPTSARCSWPASRVAPIDKLSLALTIVLAALVLGESVSWKVALGATLMVIGSLLTLS